MSGIPLLANGVSCGEHDRCLRPCSFCTAIPEGSEGAAQAPFAALMTTGTKADRQAVDLDRQEWFSPVRRQVGIAGVDEQSQQTVVSHNQAQLDDPLAAKLLKPA